MGNKVACQNPGEKGWDGCFVVVEKHKDPARQTHTFVIAVKTFSRMAFGWAVCGPLAWMLRAMAHGLAMNLKV